MQTGSLKHKPKDKLLLQTGMWLGKKSPWQALLASSAFAGQKEAEIGALGIRPHCARCCINTEQKQPMLQRYPELPSHGEKPPLIWATTGSLSSYSDSRFLLCNTQRNPELFSLLQTCNKICTMPVLNAFFVHYSGFRRLKRKLKGHSDTRAISIPEHANNLAQKQESKSKTAWKQASLKFLTLKILTPFLFS